MILLKLIPVCTAYVLVVMSPCSKDNPTTEQLKDNPGTEQLLTGKTWKAQEIRVQQSDNITRYYRRGSRKNTVDYDSDSLKFNNDNTGTYYYENVVYATKWRFTDEEKTKMTLLIDYPLNITVYLENIHITASWFKYSQYFAEARLSYIASCTRTPDP